MQPRLHVRSDGCGNICRDLIAISLGYKRAQGKDVLRVRREGVAWRGGTGMAWACKGPVGSSGPLVRCQWMGPSARGAQAGAGARLEPGAVRSPPSVAPERWSGQHAHQAPPESPVPPRGAERASSTTCHATPRHPAHCIPCRGVVSVAFRRAVSFSAVQCSACSAVAVPHV